MSFSLLFCSALLFVAANGRSTFNHTQVSVGPSNGTGMTVAPNGTIYSTLPPPTSAPCPFLNGTVIYANGTHFLVAASSPIGSKAYGNSSGCPPVNGNTTSTPLNGTVLTTPSPYVNGSQPFNSTYAPFTNGTFGIYGNGTHFWLAPSILKSNFSRNTIAPSQNATQFTLSPGNFTQAPPTNYTQSPIGNYTATPSPISNSTGSPPNGTIYSTLPPFPGNYSTPSPTGNFSLGSSLLQNVLSSQKKDQPVVINIILGQN